MKYTDSRRFFVKLAVPTVVGAAVLGQMYCRPIKTKSQEVVMAEDSPFFRISLAQWSLHRAYEKKERDPQDFAQTASDEFGINAIEYVNGFYTDHAGDTNYWHDLRRRAEDHNVKSLLIMIDDEGDLGSTDDTERFAAVENHLKWVDAAQILGCHSIRVNAFGEGTKEDVGQAMIDGLGNLCTYAEQAGIHVLIENHGLYSSDAQWVGGVIDQVAMKNCGTLPDFGNFCLSRKWGSTQDGTCEEVYDRYQGVREMMPYAKGVSAKSYAFDDQGRETTIDYAKMIQIVKDAGFDGYIGIEYEGDGLSEIDGIRATHRLLLAMGS